MTDLDLAALERDIVARVAGAPDEAALEAERVAALGKKGVVSDLLKGLGGDDAGGAPDHGPGAERAQGPHRRGDRRPPRRC